MPDQSSHDAALKAGKHVLFGSFFLFEYGDPVAIYTVDTTPSFPTYDLDVTLGSGSASAVKYGMVYTVETSGGKSKGAGTLRYAGTISSGNLPVRELSRGVIDVAAGDLVKVYRYWIPVDKLVGATIDFNPDGLSYSDQGSNPPPVGVNGGAWAGFPSQLPLPLTDSLGYVVDPDSSSAVTVSRTLPAGLSYASGDDTTLDVTVEGDEGTYWIETVVTDPDNSKSLTRYTPVCINAHPLDCTVEPYGGDVDNGWRMTVTFREQVDIPRGMWGAFVVREFIDGVEGSFGASAPGRSHIKFFGMVRRRSAEGSGADGVQTVSYEFVSPLAWLLETPGFSKVMLNDASPDAWHKMKGLDTKRAPLQIFQFYSNAPHILDITFRDNYRVKDYPGFFLEKNTPIAQVRELADGVGARLICTRQGAFEFHTRLRFLPLADRSSAVTMLTPSLDSILRYSLNVEMKDPLEKLYFLGFVGGILPFPIPFRIAYPGKAPGTGVDSPQFDKMICDSLADAEREAGRRGAMVQGKFIGTDGEAREAHTVELVLYGSLDVFDLYGEWVKLPAIPNVARIDTSKYRYELDSINIENTGGTARVTLRLSSETNGAPGQYDPPPPEDSAGFPDFDWDYDEPIGLPPTAILRLPTWNGVDSLPTKLFVCAADAAKVFVARAWDAASASPIYEDISTGLGGTSCIWACSNPYDYRERLVLTDAGLYRCPDIWTSSPSWTQVATPTALFADASGIGTAIYNSINRRGFYIIPTGGSGVALTFDNGATWQQVNVAGGAFSAGTAIGTGTIGIAVSARNSLSSGRIYAISGSPFSGIYLYRSDNWGLTWTLVDDNAAMGWDGNITVTPRINLPYTRRGGAANPNDASQQLYMVAGSGGTRGQVIHSAGAGATWTTAFYVNAGGSTPKPRGSVAGYNIQTFTHDANIVFWAYHEGVHLSGDGGVTPTAFGIPNAGDQETFVNGFASHSQAVLVWNRNGGAGVLRWTVDAGANWVNAALPGGVTFLAYAEWDLSDFVPPT